MEGKSSKEYEELLEILYPGYATMSDKKKELIEMRSFDIIRFSKEIKILLAEMKNPESPLYQLNSNDKDLVNIACTYSRIYEGSQRINKPTGRVIRGGQYYDKPEDEYKNVPTTQSEQTQLITLAVEQYNNNRIRPGNLINRLVKRNIPEINLTAALEAKKVLDSVLSIEKQENAKDDQKVSEEERG